MTHYVQLNVHTRFGPTDDVPAIFEAIAPRLAELGWTLIGAWRPVMGDVSLCWLLFELRDVADVANIRNAVRTDPAITAAFQQLQGFVINEDLVLLERLSNGLHQIDPTDC